MGIPSLIGSAARTRRGPRPSVVRSASAGPRRLGGRTLRRGCVAVGVIAVLVSAAAGCGGSDDHSRDSSGGSAPALSVPTTMPSGPPAGLVRGNAEGLNITVSLGGAHLAQSDVTSDRIRRALDGQTITLRCTTETGDEITSREQRWPSGASDLTLVMESRGEIRECSIDTGGASVLTARMAPVGTR